MKKINIGIIINKDGVSLGYNLKDGFFMLKEPIFLNGKINPEIPDGTIWFTNIEEKKLKYKNFKSINFFEIPLNQILLFNGMKFNKSTTKFYILKLYDLVNTMLLNSIEIFPRNTIEDVNATAKNNRYKRRLNYILEARTYLDLLNMISNDFSINNVTEIFNINQKSYKLMPHKVFSTNFYKDNNQENAKIKPYFLSKRLNESKKNIRNKKTFEIDVFTLNLKGLSLIKDQKFYSINDYELTDVPVNIDKKILIEKDDYLMFEIIIKDIDNKSSSIKSRLMKNLINNNFLVSKSELIFYINNGFNIIILSALKIKKEHKLKHIFEFETKSLERNLIEPLLTNKYYNMLYSYNYLQIIKKNDNFLLNEWIKSELTGQTLSIIEKLSKKRIEVIEFNEIKIKIAVNHNEKNYTRLILDELELLYSSDLF